MARWLVLRPAFAILLEIGSEVDLYSLADFNLPMEVRQDIMCEFVTVHAIATFKSNLECSFENLLRNKRGWGNNSLETTQRSTLGCLRQCKLTKGCRFWTYDRTAAYGHYFCWLWVDRDPDEIRDAMGWTSGSFSEERRYKNYDNTDPFVGRPYITEGILNEWAVMTYKETAGMRYVLEKRQRGHCSKNAECHCFPPYRGPLCEHEHPAREPAKAYRAVLHYLTSNDDDDLRDILRSLPRLWDRYNKFHDYPVVIFHDGLDESKRKLMVDASESRIWFDYVDDFKDLPDTVKNVPAHMRHLKEVKWSIGYRGMCRFRTGPVFLQPVMKHYDYAMTLDSDGYFTEEVTADPLQKFHDGNYTYAFSHVLPDQPGAVRHFWPYTLAFMAMNDIHPIGTSILRDFINHDFLDWDHEVYMNDIEIVSLAYFADPNGVYQDYFRYLDSMDGFWLHRWGDHAVRTIAVGMFVPRSEVYEMDIPYGHQGFCKCTSPMRCVKEGEKGTKAWKGEEKHHPWFVCPNAKMTNRSEVEHGDLVIRPFIVKEESARSQDDVEVAPIIAMPNTTDENAFVEPATGTCASSKVTKRSRRSRKKMQNVTLT
eukprot:GEMP01008577.1.p1 GENE.GEMP01008577.1~~GEMP01008577.1.p1  ORF type:complete len:595 (+),score=109.10 GEMP01008577.1:1614-3398(+)